MEGMRAFLRARRKDLDRGSTYFLNLDSLGRGQVRYLTGEGLAVSFAMDRRLVELCSAIAAADREGEERFGAEPLARGFASDALPVRLARLPATTITTLEPGALVAANYHRAEDVPGRIDPDALDRAHDFTLELVRQLDREAGRRTRVTSQREPAAGKPSSR